MIREIIVSNTACEIFLIFCLSSLINNFIVKSNIWEPQKHQNLNISRTIHLKKIPHTLLNIICAQISSKNFFSKMFFSRTWSFNHDYKTTNLGLIFFHKKLFCTFLQVWLFNFNIILSICCKNVFRKTVKKWWFYAFK